MTEECISFADEFCSKLETHIYRVWRMEFFILLFVDAEKYYKLMELTMYAMYKRVRLARLSKYSIMCNQILGIVV